MKCGKNARLFCEIYRKIAKRNICLEYRICFVQTYKALLDDQGLEMEKVVKIPKITAKYWCVHCSCFPFICVLYFMYYRECIILLRRKVLC